MNRLCLIAILTWIGYFLAVQPIFVYAQNTSWISQIKEYPVGQTDPYTNELHRLQVLRLTSDDLTRLSNGNTGLNLDAYALAEQFENVYQSLQLKFDAFEFEDRKAFLFERDLVEHKLTTLDQSKGNRTYSVHVDRFADPRFAGAWQGAILLVPGTGSYSGNYLKFALGMAVFKGYIVYLIDPLFHGRSHGFKQIRKAVDGPGTGIFLDRAISKDGQWDFQNALEQGWEEISPCEVNMDYNVTTILGVGRRIAFREKENLKHLDAKVLEIPVEERNQEWYGKASSQVTHLTLIGTSQGGETAFWASDPRLTGQATQAPLGIQYPFDSVICHNLYNTAFDSPRANMYLLRNTLGGAIALNFMRTRDSLWSNADWTDYYEGIPLFMRVADRWVRWRYDLEGYRNLLRYGKQHASHLNRMKIPLLVVMGRDDELYANDGKARRLVKDVIRKLDRDPEGESCWYLEYQTPNQSNGHQLLVHHTLDFMELVDCWIRYRQSGPGTSFQYPQGIWRRVD